MPKLDDSFFAVGLSATYAGSSNYQKGNRAGFNFESSDFSQDGSSYHDEWFADRAGGGQELIRVSRKVFTRVYAGGTILESKLSKLGTSKVEVINYLKKIMREHGSQIRLHTNFSITENNWKYKYKVIGSNAEIPLTSGQELIYFKNTLVFEQSFVISPVD